MATDYVRADRNKLLSEIKTYLPPKPEPIYTSISALGSSGSHSSLPGRVPELSSLEDFAAAAAKRKGPDADCSPPLHSELQYKQSKILI